MSFDKLKWADWVRDKKRALRAAFGVACIVIGTVVLNLAILAAAAWVVVWVLQSMGVL